MRELIDSIKEVVDFFEIFYESWEEANFSNKSFNEKITQELKLIEDSIRKNKEVLRSIYNPKEAGVLNVSDLITYLFTSRLAYMLDSLSKKLLKMKNIKEPKNEEELKNIKKEISAFFEIWFSMINFLLITNIFEPNDNIDLYDLGNGKYSEFQKELRKNITKRIIIKLFKNASKGLHKDKLVVHIQKILLKFNLKKLDRLCNVLGIDTKCFRRKKEPRVSSIIEELKENPENTIKILVDEPSFLEKLVEYFMSNKTPSFLLKNVGLARELLTFLLLISDNVGYAIPLLLHQRLYFHFNIKEIVETEESKVSVAPPDFLIMKNGRVIGLEIGRGKPELMSTFSAISGLPTVFVVPVLRNKKFSIERDLGFKCNLCHTSYLICPKYQELFISGEIKEISSQDTYCLKLCGEKAKDCPYAVVKVRIPWKNGDVNDRDAIVHYKCFQEHYPEKAKTLSLENLFPLFPYLSGIEILKLGFM